MGIPEGKGKVMSDYFKISGPDRGPDCGIFKINFNFQIWV
jgi:hypothetical protein